MSSQAGFSCTSNVTETQTTSCYFQPCPVDCIWNWSQYSPCSLSCGVGTSTRSVIVTQQSSNGGLGCPAVHIQAIPCVVSLCSDCSVSSNGPNGVGCVQGACVDDIPFDGNFTCQCASGYTGSNCQLGLSLACIILHHSFNNAAPGDCQIPTNGPDQQTCLNGGRCIDIIPLDNLFTCDCGNTIYTGSNCQTGNNTSHLNFC